MNQNPPSEIIESEPEPVPMTLLNQSKIPVSKQLRLAFTGRLKVGKDYCAQAANAELYGFADPIYAICRRLFGTDNKDLPGMREAMQSIGQWGRGAISQQYPISPERGSMTVLLQQVGEKMAGAECHIDWKNYGLSPDIWLDGLFRRLAQDTISPVIAINNVRFENEFRRCQAEGCLLFHVMCSPSTYAERLKKVGLSLNSPVLQDESEKLARTLDQRVVDSAARDGSGGKMLVIWNDSLKAPSNRFLSLQEFRELVGRLKCE